MNILCMIFWLFTAAAETRKGAKTNMSDGHPWLELGGPTFQINMLIYDAQYFKYSQ